MFTGIVEEIGSVLQTGFRESLAYLTIRADTVLEDTKIGESIAVNGVCLTVLELTNNSFSATMMQETLKSTNLGRIQKKERVNLERALKISDRLDGHIVTGHIDGTGDIKDIKRSARSVLMTIQTYSNFIMYLVEKGSVAIDGVSLTVIDHKKESFQVSILPHTLAKTTLGFRRCGDKVNLEGDILAKHAMKCAQRFSQTSKSNITTNFLEEHGYL